MTGIGSVELMVLFISTFGPLIAGVYLAARLNRRRGQSNPPT